MSSAPSEVLRDVLLPLNRWTLDNVQFTSRRFLRLITERISDVCLRWKRYAIFRVPEEHEKMGVTAYFQFAGLPERTTTHPDTAHLFPDFVQALRSAHVRLLTIDDEFTVFFLIEAQRLYFAHRLKLRFR